MNSYFKGQFPFYEVWYGKFHISQEEAFWFRYTLLNGKTKESALWAIYFKNNQITARKKIFSLSQIQLTNSCISLPSGLFDDKTIEGYLPDIQWELAYENKNGTFDPIPSLFKRLHLSKSFVFTPLLDGSFSGKIVVHGTQHTIKNSPGMMGHIWGTKQAHEWAWAHCNDFNHPGVIFEGLSARISFFHLPSPPLTSLYFKYEGQEYLFNTIKDAFKIRSSFGYTFWNFKAHHSKLTLIGKVTSHPQKIAIITYTDTDDSQLFCHNSKLANIELTVLERHSKIKKVFTSQGKAGFEWVTRKEVQGQKYL